MTTGESQPDAKSPAKKKSRRRRSTGVKSRRRTAKQKRDETRYAAPARFDIDSLTERAKAMVFAQIVEATVVDANEDAFQLEVERDGADPVMATMPRAEVMGEPPIPGSEVEVFLEEGPEGPVASIQKARTLHLWEEVESAHENKEPINGYLVGPIKGGFVVSLGATSRLAAEAGDGLRAFLPMSQARVSRNETPDWADEMRFFHISDLEPAEGDIIVSIRDLLKADQKQAREDLWNALELDQVREGTVKSLTRYGAFVDLGGDDGLLHISDYSWEREPRVRDVLAVGQKLKVKVIALDPKKKKIKLGVKQLTPDPWLKVSEKYAEGTEVEGDIVALADYGAFMKLEGGVEGLIHVSEIAWKKVKHPADKFNIGDHIKAGVLGVNTKARRISLSTKILEKNPVEKLAEKFEVGTVVKTTVKSITDFGLFVSLDEDVDGLVHIGELSWIQKVDHPSDIHQEGDEVEVVVTGFDTKRQRVSCSIKRLKDDPWAGWEKTYAVGSRHQVTVTRVVEQGVEVDVEEGLSGFIPKRELSSEPVTRVQDVAKVGQEFEAQVSQFERRRQKVSFSVKALETAETREAYEDYKKREGDSGEGRMTIGDAIREKSGSNKD
jgi:small subunit ribosomal protein S1